LHAALETPDACPGPLAQLEQEGEAGRLRAALLKLRADRRELIILARYREMKHDAIADLLGIDIGAVKVRIHRALKELREILLHMPQEPSCNAKRSRPTSLTI
jgi:RNA polymerase sigma-70 factor (ECF subfamily)